MGEPVVILQGHTVLVMSKFSDATFARHERRLQMVSHLACWLNIESMT